MSIASADPARTGCRVCQHCGQQIEPMRFDELGKPTTDEGETVYRVPRRFCPCPGGQADEAAVEAEQDREAWLSQARQLTVGLEAGLYGRYRFTTWDAVREGQNAEEVYRAVSGYVQHVIAGRTKRWLYLYGLYGLGKTHLAVAAVRQIAAELLLEPVVAVWPQHCSAVQQSWDRQQQESAPTERKLWGMMRRAGILLLDDIDKQRSTPWALQKLYEIVDYRMINDKVTIITANHSIKELRAIWESDGNAHIRDTSKAVLSRISGQIYSSVQFAGQDQRWR